MLAPIGRDFFFSDLMKRWKTTVIVVARLGIGTINQTLLTCRFLKNEGIKVAGVILNDLSEKTDATTRTNREVLARYLDVPIMGVFPHMEHTETMDRNILASIVEQYIDASPLFG